jgi:hypothetical protein
VLRDTVQIDNPHGIDPPASDQPDRDRPGVEHDPMAILGG